jgi:hypothetical protein
MFKGRILPADVTTPIVPEELRLGVLEANKILDELLPTDSTDIFAEWQFESTDDEGVYVRLMLYTMHRGKKVGFVDFPIQAEVFANEASLRRGLSNPVFILNRVLSHLLKFENFRMRSRLEQSLLPVGVD